jgi:hypothetical protein
VYVVVAVLFIAGVHIPVIPFVELTGRAGMLAPRQYGPAWVKVGVIEFVISMVIVVVEAH